MYASFRAALRYYFELEPTEERKTIIELMALAIDGDASALSALKRQAQAIGKGLYLLNAVLSPDVILLAGDFTTFYDVYREIIEAECRIGA